MIFTPAIPKSSLPLQDRIELLNETSSPRQRRRSQDGNLRLHFGWGGEIGEWGWGDDSFVDARELYARSRRMRNALQRASVLSRPGREPRQRIIPRSTRKAPTPLSALLPRPACTYACNLLLDYSYTRTAFKLIRVAGRSNLTATPHRRTYSIKLSPLFFERACARSRAENRPI